MIRQTFFSYRNYRWLWINVIALLLCIAVYCVNKPLGGRNGGTVVGYTFGGIATAAIMYLMWFGIRKRSHYARYTSLQGCLAVHVWLGIMLAFLVPLHAGFQFGFNVHTLAYVLMLATITSGIIGAVIYISYPPRVQSHRGGGTVKSLLEQVAALSKDIDFLGKDRSDDFYRLLDRVDFVFKPSVARALWQKKIEDVPPKEVASLLSKLSQKESDEGYQVVSLASKKRQLVHQVYSEIRLMAAFRSWLYVHLPLSFGLIAALAIHIFSVFYYR